MRERVFSRKWLRLSVVSVCLSVCDVGILWPNGWMDQSETGRAVQVYLGPCHIALDGDPASPKRSTAPHFSAHVSCGQTAGLSKMPCTWYGGRPHCVRWAPSYSNPSLFRPMSITAKRSPISATAEHLYKSYHKIFLDW